MLLCSTCTLTCPARGLLGGHARVADSHTAGTDGHRYITRRVRWVQMSGFHRGVKDSKQSVPGKMSVSTISIYYFRILLRNVNCMLTKSCHLHMIKPPTLPLVDDLPKSPETQPSHLCRMYHLEALWTTWRCAESKVTQGRHESVSGTNTNNDFFFHFIKLEKAAL